MKFLKFNASNKKIVHIKGENTLTLCALYNGEYEEYSKIPSKHRICGHCKKTYERLNPGKKVRKR
ncbi:MAG TPA: hypothetical protein VJ991_15195 [Balneolales bacterium]|nr:hypothetical protein [Balneolales bacterium]